MLGGCNFVVSPFLDEHVAGELTRHYIKGKTKLNSFFFTKNPKDVLLSFLVFERYVLGSHSRGKKIVMVFGLSFD